MRHVAGLQKLGYYVTLQKAERADAGCSEAPASSLVGDGVAPDTGSVSPDADSLAPRAATEPVRRRPGRPCKCAEKGIRCTHRNNPHPDAQVQKAKEIQTHEKTSVSAECFS